MTKTIEKGCWRELIGGCSTLGRAVLVTDCKDWWLKSWIFTLVPGLLLLKWTLGKKIDGGRGWKWKEGQAELELQSRESAHLHSPLPLASRRRSWLSGTWHLGTVQGRRMNLDPAAQPCFRAHTLTRPLSCFLPRRRLRSASEEISAWWVTACPGTCRTRRWHSQRTSSVTYDNTLCLLIGWDTDWCAHLFTKYVLTAWGLLDLNRTVGGAISVFKSRFSSNMSCLMFTVLNSELNCYILTTV